MPRHLRKDIYLLVCKAHQKAAILLAILYEQHFALLIDSSPFCANEIKCEIKVNLILSVHGTGRRAHYFTSLKFSREHQTDVLIPLRSFLYVFKDISCIVLLSSVCKVFEAVRCAACCLFTQAPHCGGRSQRCATLLDKQKSGSCNKYWSTTRECKLVAVCSIIQFHKIISFHAWLGRLFLVNL